MAKCNTCGVDEATYNRRHKYNTPTICSWCASQIPGVINDLAEGRIEPWNSSIGSPNYNLFVGFWTKDNYLEYPPLKERREKAGIAQICTTTTTNLKEDHWNCKCPACGANAYQGLGPIECSKGCK